MTLPTIYVDTGGATTNSGSTDNNTATVSSASSGFTAAVSGTTVTFSGNTDLSGVSADGSQTIYIADATNSNQKIFRITAVDDGANTVTVDTAPTGTIAASAWAIGGRFVWTKSAITAAVKAGWTVQFNNSPAAASGASLIDISNDGNSTNGPIRWIGKAGAKRTLSGSGAGLIGGSGRSGHYFSNLELSNSGSNPLDFSNFSHIILDDVKVSAASNGTTLNNGLVINCEFSGCSSPALTISNNGSVRYFGNYIHDNSSHGFSSESTSEGSTFVNNIFDTNAGRGYYNQSGSSGVQVSMFWGNTVYGGGNSGFESTSGNLFGPMINNIFSENGNAAGEYNVEMTAGGDWLIHRYNNFYHSGGGGAANLLNITAGSTEPTTDPTFTDAANADFSIGSSSPAKAAGWPGAFLGAGSTGYLDIGAVQRQEAGSSGGGGPLIDGRLVR